MCLVISCAVPEDEWTLAKLMVAFEAELKVRKRAAPALTRGTATAPRKKLPATGVTLWVVLEGKVINGGIL